jgi:hypothetical protein
MKIYIYSITRRPIFLGSWKSIPNSIIGKVGPLELGERQIFDQKILWIRKGVRICLKHDRFFPWAHNTILQAQKPLVIILDQVKRTTDIVGRIPQVEALIEIRTKTILKLIITGLYEFFIEKNNSNRIAARKTLHFTLRTIIDRIQRIYSTNGVSIDIKHLELIVRPIAFVQVVPARKIIHLQKNKISYHGSIIRERFPIEIIERINWNYIWKHWRKQEFSNVLESIVHYEPVLKGLIESSLSNYSFLSAASFQTTSRVLAHAALFKQRDHLRGLKENLILGNCLPIGMNTHLFNRKNKIDLINKPKYDFNKKNSIYQNTSIFWWYK